MKGWKIELNYSLPYSIRSKTMTKETPSKTICGFIMWNNQAIVLVKSKIWDPKTFHRFRPKVQSGPNVVPLSHQISIVLTQANTTPRLGNQSSSLGLKLRSIKKFFTPSFLDPNPNSCFVNDWLVLVMNKTATFHH